MKVKAGIFLSLFLMFCSSLLSQQISIKAEEQPLNQVLETLIDQYQLRLSFDASELSNYTVSIQATEEPIEDFLERLLAPYHLIAKRNKNFFYIQSTRRSLVFLISDQKNGAPLPYATINIKNSYKGNTANDKGLTQLKFDQRDTALLISAFGYRTIEYNPKDSKGDTVRLALGINSIDLEAVTILEYINRGIRLVGDISSPSLLLADMEVLPGLPEADVLLSTQMLPGIESNDETAAGINIRGSDPSQTMLYWDRIPVYKPAHYFGQITSIIPSMTQKIDAYKNYIPSSYSGATSGLLNMKAEDSISLQTAITSNTTFTHTELSVKSPINRTLSVQVGGRVSYNHLWNTPLFDAYSDKLFEGVREISEDDEEAESDSELKFWDLNAKVIYQPNERNYWSISAIANRDQLDYKGSEVNDSNQVLQDHLENFRGVNGLYRHRFNSDWSTKLSLSLTDYDAEDNSANVFNEVDINEFDSTFIANELNSIEAKTALIYSGWEGHEVEFGYQLHHYETSLDYRESTTFEAPLQELRSTTEIVNGVYGKAEIQVSDRWLIRPQLRADYFSKEEEWSINPIINSQFNLGKGFWLKASAGSYAQALSSINDATLSASNVSSGIWVLAGEEDTEVLKSTHGSFGFFYQQKGWIVDVDLYTKKATGISAINLFEESLSEELDFELGESNSSGIDLMVKKNFGRYHSWMSYSFSETNNTFDSLGTSTFASSLDRPHQFRWVHTYIINQFEFSLGWTYKSGSPYTRGNEAIYNADDDEYFIEYNEINAVRLPDYHRMDFSFWYRFPNQEKTWNGVLGVSLMNLYNRENVWKRFYNLEDINDDDIPEVEEIELFFLGITPNVTLKLNF